MVMVRKKATAVAVAASDQVRANEKGTPGTLLRKGNSGTKFGEVYFFWTGILSGLLFWYPKKYLPRISTVKALDRAPSRSDVLEAKSQT